MWLRYKMPLLVPGHEFTSRREIVLMSFIKRLIVSQAILLIGALGAMAGPVDAQVKGKAPLPSPVIERGPSNVDLVNKALNPGASNPDVPLPHPDLATPAGSQPGMG